MTDESIHIPLLAAHQDAPDREEILERFKALYGEGEPYEPLPQDEPEPELADDEAALADDMDEPSIEEPSMEELSGADFFSAEAVEAIDEEPQEELSGADFFSAAVVEEMEEGESSSEEPAVEAAGMDGYDEAESLEGAEPAEEGAFGDAEGMDDYGTEAYPDGGAPTDEYPDEGTPGDTYGDEEAGEGDLPEEDSMGDEIADDYGDADVEGDPTADAYPDDVMDGGSDESAPVEGYDDEPKKEDDAW